MHHSRSHRDQQYCTFRGRTQTGIHTKAEQRKEKVRQVRLQANLTISLGRFELVDARTHNFI